MAMLKDVPGKVWGFSNIHGHEQSFVLRRRNHDFAGKTVVTRITRRNGLGIDQ